LAHSVHSRELASNDSVKWNDSALAMLIKAMQANNKIDFFIANKFND